MNSTEQSFCHLPTRRRAAPSGIALTEIDAALVKGMLVRGDRSHDIASWFGVNPGRIADIATGKTFANVPFAPEARVRLRSKVVPGVRIVTAFTAQVRGPPRGMAELTTLLKPGMRASAESYRLL